MVHGSPDFYRRTREKGEESRHHRRYGVMAADTKEVMVDLPGCDVTIEFLEFASEYDLSTLIIEPYKSDETLDVAFGLIQRTGGFWAALCPYAIHNHEAILWHELIYDTTNNYYKFGLGYPIRFANGVKITVYQTHPTLEKSLGCAFLLTVRG